jgi:hypothetical protein
MHQSPRRRGQALKDLFDTHFSNAEKITLVQEISTPTGQRRYTRPSRRRGTSAGHYTPKHGSWLHMAKSELSVLSGQR